MDILEIYCFCIFLKRYQIFWNVFRYSEKFTKTHGGASLTSKNRTYFILIWGGVSQPWKAFAHLNLLSGKLFLFLSLLQWLASLQKFKRRNTTGCKFWRPVIFLPRCRNSYTFWTIFIPESWTLSTHQSLSQVVVEGPEKPSTQSIVPNCRK